MIFYGLDKETKYKRIENAKQSVEKIFNEYFNIPVESNKKMIAYIVIFLHWALILGSYAYIILAPISLNYVIISSLLIILPASLHLYYGSGCIFLRLERHFFNDKDWFGPYTIINRLVGKPIINNVKEWTNYSHATLIAVMIIIAAYKISRYFSEK